MLVMLDWELGTSRCKVSCRDPTVSTENYMQYTVINHNKKEYMYTYN